MSRPKMEIPTIDELVTYKAETVWRLTEDDIRICIQEKFPEFTKEQVEYFVQRARTKLEMEWYMEVEAFVDSRRDEVE